MTHITVAAVALEMVNESAEPQLKQAPAAGAGADSMGRVGRNIRPERRCEHELSQLAHRARGARHEVCPTANAAHEPVIRHARPEPLLRQP